jgi:hypothetical protein
MNARENTTPAPDRVTWHWRKLRAGETDHELLWLVVLPTTGGLYLLLKLFFPPMFQCKFKALTGIPCATCGGTRSVLAVLRDFDLAAAFWNNPLVFIGLGFLTIYLGYAATVLLLRRPRLRLHIPKRRRMQMGAVFLALLLINWAYLIWVGR